MVSNGYVNPNYCQRYGNYHNTAIAVPSTYFRPKNTKDLTEENDRLQAEVKCLQSEVFRLRNQQRRR